LVERVELVVKQGVAKHLLGHDVKCKDCPFRKNLWCAWHNTFLGEAMIMEGIIHFEGEMTLRQARKLLDDAIKEASPVAFAVKYMNDEDFAKFIKEG